MSATQAVQELAEAARHFGGGAAKAKLAALDAVAGRRRIGKRALLALQDVLCFLRAYPDDARVRDRVLEVGEGLSAWTAALPGGAESESLVESGLPGTVNVHNFGFGVLRRMVRYFPGSVDVDWDDVEDTMALHHALVTLVTPGERAGLDDIETTWRAWIDASRPDDGRTDLEFVLGFFERAHLSLEAKGNLFDECHLPVRYRLDTPGTALFDVAWPREAIHYQTEEIDRGRVPLPPTVTIPFASLRLLSPKAGRALLRLSLATLGCRSLEILMLTWADPRDAYVLDCGRGLEVALLGSLPETRDPLSTNYFFLVIKNGVPIGYGPVSVCLGTCEMGLNLFPAFRGGEIPYIYAHLMRVFYQVLGARYFALTSYAMGAGNPAAIRTGAFWFYRKLGFRATEPAVEALAQTEEAKMRTERRYRCSTSTLHRLSHTGAVLDLSDGTCRSVHHGRLGTRQTRFIEETFGGDRRRAQRVCRRRAARALGIDDLARWSDDELRALNALAPILCLLPDPTEWSAAEKRRTVRFVRVKGGRSEARADILLFGNRRLRDGLFALQEE